MKITSNIFLFSRQIFLLKQALPHISYIFKHLILYSYIFTVFQVSVVFLHCIFFFYYFYILKKSHWIANRQKAYCKNVWNSHHKIVLSKNIIKNVMKITFSW